MDPAVALVQAYFYANGYFTVTEYSVVEQSAPGMYRSATDVDLLAVRFPGARRLVPSGDPGGEESFVAMTDPALGNSDDRVEFVIAEVKEGRAELNRGARDPHVLRTALVRFGAFEPSDMDHMIEGLIRKGETATPSGARVRLMAFGAYQDPKRTANWTVITLGQVVDYLDAIATRYADMTGAMQFKDPAVGMLSVLIKARRGRRR